MKGYPRMIPYQDERLSLKITALMNYLPAVLQCVETSAAAFGLGRDESLKLRLAAEEIFSYLCSRVCRGAPLEMICRGCLSHARVEFHFSVSSLDMGALNITTAVPVENIEQAEEVGLEVGLVIASRIIDRLHLQTDAQNHVVLSIEQDKFYPALPASVKTFDIRGALTVETPDLGGIQRFALQMGSCAKDPLRPAFFNYPGKTADMVTAEHCLALIARNTSGNIAGGILYRPLTEKIFEIFSPCIFSPRREEEISSLLFEECLLKTAKTKAVGLVSLTGLPAFLQPQFETLGELTYHRVNDAPIISPAFCRLLHEDPGFQVWAHPALKGYLEKEYSRLFLARDIQPARELGDARAGQSIFGTEMRRERAEALLRPLWPGNDFSDNLNRHLALCRKESSINIFFTLDLGVYWHAFLAPVLISAGFTPKVIIPFAGQADLVIFQYDKF